MHKSAYDIGGKFLDRYWNKNMQNILELGSLDVNGTLRDFQPENSNWIGVDLEPGKGVDMVVERVTRLPFEDKFFDLVVATSIFEHDPMFWMTFEEMLRVTKDGGFIYVRAPSNGWVHRYPMDAYRFYPDAGVALEEWGRRSRGNLRLEESFISERDGDMWNDFSAVFSLGRSYQTRKIYEDTPSTNIWNEGIFLTHTLREASEDMTIISDLENLISSNVISSKLLQIEKEGLLAENVNLQSEVDGLLMRVDLSQLEKDTLLKENVNLQSEVDELMKQVGELKNEKASILNSKSWLITKPLRTFKSLLRFRGEN
jgi:SAM-dependent methyltransferase